MTSWIVADSGIILATVLPEPNREKAKALLKEWAANHLKIAAPSLFQYEVVSVIRKHAHRGTIQTQDAVTMIKTALASPVQYFVTDALLLRGYEFASQFGRPAVYDSQYLALAEHLGCEFWTADERLFNTVSATLPWVKWIGHYQISTS